MAILSEEKRVHKKRVIDLSGPDGNAFVILGIAQNLAKQLKVDETPHLYENKTTKNILDEMRSSDYEHLIQTFDKYFGKYVDLQR